MMYMLVRGDHVEGGVIAIAVSEDPALLREEATLDAENHGVSLMPRDWNGEDFVIVVLGEVSLNYYIRPIKLLE